LSEVFKWIFLSGFNPPGFIGLDSPHQILIIKKYVMF